MDIGQRIRAARKRAGLSQEEVARRAGMSLKGMAYIERGHIEDPHISSVRSIADALGVPVGELLGEPVLAGKAEAPDAGPPARTKSVIDLVREAAAKQYESNWQAVARAHESTYPQASYVEHENEVMKLLLERHPGDLAEACIDLGKYAQELEQMNARLAEQLERMRLENAQLKEELARAHVND